MMKKVTSKDGTPIAFDQSGEGEPVILVAGALGVRSHPMTTHLAELLAPHFTVLNYDRRGRGDSGDTAPYAVQREVEDIEALIDEAGGSAFLYGISSGAVLALEAASRLPSKVKKLAMYEPPFFVDDSRAPLAKDYVRHLNDLVSSGRRGDAVEYFMTEAVGVPAEFLGQMRNQPMWPEMETVAHTLAYDGAIMGDNVSGNPLPAGQWASATSPTLVMDGGASPQWLRKAAQAIAEVLPNPQYRTLEGQTHGVEGEALAPVLVEFFGGKSGTWSRAAHGVYNEGPR
jgi:pimeloyl-ACP methyl ester carboxylesterase